MTNLAKKTWEICEELSTPKKQLTARKIRGKSIMPEREIDIYFGMMPKKWYQFRNSPTFRLEEKEGKIILTSFSKNYDNRIKEIAEKNGFGYNSGKFTSYS